MFDDSWSLPFHVFHVVFWCVFACVLVCALCFLKASFLLVCSYSICVLEGFESLMCEVGNPRSLKPWVAAGGREAINISPFPAMHPGAMFKYVASDDRPSCIMCSFCLVCRIVLRVRAGLVRSRWRRRLRSAPLWPFDVMRCPRLLAPLCSDPGPAECAKRLNKLIACLQATVRPGRSRQILRETGFRNNSFSENHRVALSGARESMRRSAGGPRD